MLQQLKGFDLDRWSPIFPITDRCGTPKAPVPTPGTFATTRGMAWVYYFDVLVVGFSKVVISLRLGPKIRHIRHHVTLHVEDI